VVDVAKRSNQFVPVHARHRKVREHHVETIVRELQGLAAAAGKGNRKAFDRESAFEQLQGVEMIVDNEDPWSMHDG